MPTLNSREALKWPCERFEEHRLKGTIVDEVSLDLRVHTSNGASSRCFTLCASNVPPQKFKLTLHADCKELVIRRIKRTADWEISFCYKVVCLISSALNSDIILYLVDRWRNWVEVERVNSREIPQRWLDDRRELRYATVRLEPERLFSIISWFEWFPERVRLAARSVVCSRHLDNSRLRKHIALSTSDMYVCRMFVKSWHGRCRYDSNTCIRTTLIKVLNGRDRLRRIGSKCSPLIFIRSCRMVAYKSLLFCIKYWVERFGFYVEYWVKSCM